MHGNAAFTSQKKSGTRLASRSAKRVDDAHAWSWLVELRGAWWNRLRLQSTVFVQDTWPIRPSTRSRRSDSAPPCAATGPPCAATGPQVRGSHMDAKCRPHHMDDASAAYSGVRRDGRLNHRVERLLLGARRGAGASLAGTRRREGDAAALRRHLAVTYGGRTAVTNGCYKWWFCGGEGDAATPPVVTWQGGPAATARPAAPRGLTATPPRLPSLSNTRT